MGSDGYLTVQQNKAGLAVVKIDWQISACSYNDRIDLFSNREAWAKPGEI